MQMGRTFEVTEAIDTFNPVAILSHKTWQDEFNSAPNILDEKVSFNGVSYRVVGVLGESFVEPQLRQTGRDVGIWFPWDYNSDVRLKELWGNISGALGFVGKLKDTLNADQAEQIITPLINDIWVENVASISFFSDWSIEMKLESFQTGIVGGGLTICVTWLNPSARYGYGPAGSVIDTRAWTRDVSSSCTR